MIKAFETVKSQCKQWPMIVVADNNNILEIRTLMNLDLMILCGIKHPQYHILKISFTMKIGISKT